MFSRLCGCFGTLFVLSSCASSPPTPIEIIDSPPTQQTKLELPQLDQSKNAFGNSYILSNVNAEKRTNGSVRKDTFTSLINVAKTSVKVSSQVEFEGRVYGLTDTSYRTNGRIPYSLWDGQKNRFLNTAETNGKKAYYIYRDTPLVALHLTQNIGREKDSFVIDSVEQLRSREWDLNDLPPTPLRTAYDRSRVDIQYKVDRSGRMTDITFPSASERFSRLTPENMDKWRRLLGSLRLRLIKGQSYGKSPYDRQYSTRFQLEHLYDTGNLGDYKAQMINHQKYVMQREEYNNSALAYIADRKARKLASEQEKKKRKEETRRLRAQQQADYQRRMAAQKAYEASPAGLKAKAKARARALAKQEEMRKARKARGWPDSAMGRIARGQWVCASYKSGLRAYMIERSGNSYASMGHDCDYIPRDLFVSDIRPTNTGIARVAILGGGSFFTSAYNIER